MRILLSIKPEFVEKIFSGQKKFEYRKTTFRNGVSSVVVYSTQPVGRVIGEFEVKKIHAEHPIKLWQKTRKHAGIDHKRFMKYFSGRDVGQALEIGSIRMYDAPEELTKFCPNGRPPQSFIYLEDQSFAPKGLAPKAAQNPAKRVRRIT